MISKQLLLFSTCRISFLLIFIYDWAPRSNTSFFSPALPCSGSSWGVNGWLTARPLGRRRAEEEAAAPGNSCSPVLPLGRTGCGVRISRRRRRPRPRRLPCCSQWPRHTQEPQWSPFGAHDATLVNLSWKRSTASSIFENDDSRVTLAYLWGHEGRVPSSVDPHGVEGQLQARVALGQAAAEVSNHQSWAAVCIKSPSHVSLYAELMKSHVKFFSDWRNVSLTRVVLQQHIVRLEVPVSDALPAQVVDRLQELQHHQRALPGVRGGLFQELSQRARVTATGGNIITNSGHIKKTSDKSHW